LPLAQGEVAPHHRRSSNLTQAETTPVPSPVPVKHRTSPAGGARQHRASPDTVYEAVQRPPADFGYQPIHDFWNELSKLGPTSIEGMHRHMLSLGWRRPSGKP
jgi:hypothetical protein